MTIRVDQIKELKLSSILESVSEGFTWVLVRKNDNEAVTERVPVDKLASMEQATLQVLKFHRVSRAVREARSQGGGKSTTSRGTAVSSASKVSNRVRFRVTDRVAPAPGVS